MSNPTWHMRRALRLAEKAKGWTNPNPMVGAVLVKDGERIGEGYHKKFGEAHAEVEAIQSCSESAEGSTLFVTLEPCSHHGKTPPCTQAIIEAGIKKVYIAALDPSEKNHGKGVKELEAAGIEVEVGLLEEAARDLNRAFFTFHEKKRPFITLKMAMSYDGKVAAQRGVETQLSGKQAQKFVHKLRHEHQAILVGAGTALTDDPHLGVRTFKGNDPLRILAKGDREIPDGLQIFRDENHWVYDVKNIQNFFEQCREREIISLLVEGGPRVITCFLQNEAYDELQLIYAPLILGENALHFHELGRELSFQLKSVQKCGQDVIYTARPHPKTTPAE